MSISVLRHGAAEFFSRGTSRTAQRRAQSFAVGTIEGLEKRLAMSATTAATPAIQMLSATTTDSKSVTIEYQVNQAPDAANPIQFGVYRSSNGQFDSSDSLVDTITLAVPGSASGQSAITLDQSGQPATAVGTHQFTLPLALSFTHISLLTEVLTVINLTAIFNNTVHLFELSTEPNEYIITI